MKNCNNDVSMNTRTLQHVSQAIVVSLCNNPAQIVLCSSIIAAKELRQRRRARAGECVRDAAVAEDVVGGDARLSRVEAAAPHDATGAASV